MFLSISDIPLSYLVGSVPVVTAIVASGSSVTYFYSTVPTSTKDGISLRIMIVVAEVETPSLVRSIGL